MSKYFGTDGIRSRAERFTPDFLAKIVMGLMRYAKSRGLDHPSVLIGGDTRESSEWILADIAAALETVGVEYGNVEVLPTPAINYCFYQMGFDFAIDVTASHNPYTDNGIKIFERVDTEETDSLTDAVWGQAGRKLSPEGIEIIEQTIDTNQSLTPVATEIHESLHQDALERYITHLTEYALRISATPDNAPGMNTLYGQAQSPSPDTPTGHSQSLNSDTLASHNHPQPSNADTSVDPLRSSDPDLSTDHPQSSSLSTADHPQTSAPDRTQPTYKDGPLSGLKIVLDCANGATSVVGVRPFTTLGAEVEVINADSSYGQSINREAGSTHLEVLATKVQSGNYDFGAAFDGDGDRCLLVDHAGETVSGDQILAIFANYLGLKKMAVTVMANQGLINWADQNGINLTITDVGDANVASAMREKGIILGGEESGHIILPGQTMGDGLLVALLMAKIIATTGQSLSDLASIMPKFPQLTTNLPATAAAKAAVRAARARLDLDNPTDNSPLTPDENIILTTLQKYVKELSKIDGRLLVRPSGTEDLVRVTLWGPEIMQIQNISDRLCAELAENFDKISHI